MLEGGPAARAAAGPGRAARWRPRGAIRGRRSRLGRGLRSSPRLRLRFLRGGSLLCCDALLLAGRSGPFRRLPLFSPRLRLLRFLRHDRLPIFAARYCHFAGTTGAAAALDPRFPANASGSGPPVAQSINSTVWTTGITVPAATCLMQPILPAAITSGLSFSIFPTLRSRNLLASSGWRML